ncbi:MAG: class I SAM-dependent methyltransferase [Promethearchaeota archaeon]
MSQWYEGRFYKEFISPHLADVRLSIASMIREGESVVDIGSGTGDLVMMLGKSCNRVVGIEASLKMIDQARELLDEHPLPGVSFVHADALDYLGGCGESFDHAVFSFSLHEMAPSRRVKLLEAAIAVSGDVIVADFNEPGPSNLFGLFNTITESLSNFRHFSRYLDYTLHGGIKALLKAAGLKLVERKVIGNSRFAVVRGIARL